MLQLTVLWLVCGIVTFLWRLVLLWLIGLLVVYCDYVGCLFCYCFGMLVGLFLVLLVVDVGMFATVADVAVSGVWFVCW